MYQRILVPLDGSSAAERGLQEALSLAALTKAHLRLLHVVDAYPIMVETAAVESAEAYHRNLLRAGEAVLARAHDTARQREVPADVVVREVHQAVADAILEEAQHAACDLIVIGSHGRRGIGRWMLGSNAEKVMRGSPVPVLVVHEQRKG